MKRKRCKYEIAGNVTTRLEQPVNSYFFFRYFFSVKNIVAECVRTINIYTRIEIAYYHYSYAYVYNRAWTS